MHNSLLTFAINDTIVTSIYTIFLQGDEVIDISIMGYAPPVAGQALIPPSELWRISSPTWLPNSISLFASTTPDVLHELLDDILEAERLSQS